MIDMKRFVFPVVLWAGLLTGFSARANDDVYANAMRAYHNGDYQSAYRLLRPLADAGHVDAQFRIGMMYENAQGVARDPAKAEYWYNQACPLPDQSGPR